MPTLEQRWEKISDTANPETRPELYHTGIQEINKSKNRYHNIVALDSTRIHLNSPYDDEYINANYVDVGTNQTFIVGQAPTPETQDLFWWMVYCHDINVIGMFTDFNDKLKIKAHRYWPDIHQIQLFCDQSLKVHCIRTEYIFSFEVSYLLLVYKNECKYVVHYHYPDWNDFDVPPNPQHIRYFLQKISPTTNTIVHCSAGCGRSGVVTTLYRHSITFEDVDEIIEDIRKYRQGLVHNLEQYKFIHKYIGIYHSNMIQNISDGAKNLYQNFCSIL